MNNKKLELYQQLLHEALSILSDQARIDFLFECDPAYCKEKEKECIELFSAKLAGIYQLGFEQISNAKVIGDLRVDKNNHVHPLFNELIKNHFIPLS